MGCPCSLVSYSLFFNWQRLISRQIRHVFNVPVHEGALNDAINYAQKGCAMQMWGITLTKRLFHSRLLDIYLLLTEFEGRTVSYGPRFSSSIYDPSAKRAADHKSKGKKRGSVTYSTNRENEVSKIFIISLVCVWGAQERFLFKRKGFKFLTHLGSKTS